MNVNNDGNLLIWIWSFLATAGGAVSSFALRPYKEMSSLEIVLAFTMSMTFGMFVGSFVAELLIRKVYGENNFNLRAYGAVMWFMATSAHLLIPVIIVRAKGIIKAGFGPSATESEK